MQQQQQQGSSFGIGARPSGGGGIGGGGDRSARTLIVRSADSSPLPNIALLSTYFSAFGVVSNVLILKDSAFVQFSSNREATAARGSNDMITMANGTRVTLGWARHDPMAPSDAPPWVSDALARDITAVKPQQSGGWGGSSAYGAAASHTPLPAAASQTGAHYRRESPPPPLPPSSFDSTTLLVPPPPPPHGTHSSGASG